MIGDFLWFGLRKKIGNLGFFFYFIFSYCGLVVAVVVLMVVVAVVVVVADGRGGYGWCCGCFLGSRIYYFYCSGYIILL